MPNLQRSKTEPISFREQMQHTGGARASSESPCSRVRKSSDELSFVLAAIARNEASNRTDTAPQRHVVSDSLPRLANVAPIQMRMKSLQPRPDESSMLTQFHQPKVLGVSSPATADDTTSRDTLKTDSNTRRSLPPCAFDEIFSVAGERGRPRHRTKPSAREHHCSRVSCTSGSWASVSSVGEELVRDLEDLEPVQRQPHDYSDTLAGVGAWTGSAEVDSDV